MDKLCAYISHHEGLLNHLIVKKSVDNGLTYFLAIGDIGSNEIGEFFAKVTYDDEKLLTGDYSYSTGSEYWSNLLHSMSFDEERMFFRCKKSSQEKPLLPEELDVRKTMIEYISDLINYENLIQDQDKRINMHFKNSNFKDIEGTILSKTWTEDFLEFTVSDIWEISYCFPSAVEQYL